MQRSYFTPSGILGLNWVAFRRMKRHNPPGPLITTLCRDGIMYVAAIVGKRYSHRVLQWSYDSDDLKVFSVINAVVTLASPVSSSCPPYWTTFHPQNTDPIRRYTQFVSLFSGNIET